MGKSLTFFTVYNPAEGGEEQRWKAERGQDEPHRGDADRVRQAQPNPQVREYKVAQDTHRDKMNYEYIEEMQTEFDKLSQTLRSESTK